MRKLTNKEQEAVNWAKANYPHWRKQHDVTREEHMAKIPEYMKRSFNTVEARLKYLDLWGSYYDTPFGIPEWNKYVQILHELLPSMRKVKQ